MQMGKGQLAEHEGTEAEDEATHHGGPITLGKILTEQKCTPRRQCDSQQAQDTERWKRSQGQGQRSGHQTDQWNTGLPGQIKAVWRPNRVSKQRVQVMREGVRPPYEKPHEQAGVFALPDVDRRRILRDAAAKQDQ
jgi:hypothetical protein